tara:strand:+ start:7082 stop:7999 length:918 start_codon:yes stop_codon:yes gene_type:complete
MIKTNSEILDQLMHLYKHGIPEGSKVGLSSFDKQLSFVKGGCTDITGYPFFGKSLFLKEIMMGLTINEGWKHCVYMPDDGSDTEVISNMMHKLTGKTFEKGYSNSITEKEISKYSMQLLDSFKFISSEHHLEPEAFWNYAKENKCNSAIIDSWNYMNHKGEPTSPDYLRKILSFRNRFMDTNKMHSFIIIHPKNPDPKQVKDGNVKKPTVYDLMGGSEWNNNGKNIVVVHKGSKENNQPYEIYVDKVKPKAYGNIGECTVHLDWNTQRFYDFDHIKQIKKYAYATEEVVKDPINTIFTLNPSEPF